MDTMANEEMARAWDGDEGEGWARDWQRYDDAVAFHHDALVHALDVGAGERVLDVGCGNGQLTRQLATRSGDGEVRGIDLSQAMLERARGLAALDGVTNAVFEQADAQTHPFPAERYDVLTSRFGVMFFSDPIAAFANLRAAAHPGGRLGMVVWRGPDANEWLRRVVGALAVGRDLAGPPLGAPGPFGLAERERVVAVLDGAGFTEISVDPLDGPYWAGPDAGDATAFFRGAGIFRGFTQDLSPAQVEEAIAALSATMAEHETADGVVFDSGTWLVRARC
ncbi:MAG: methyltransferase domain-containing protein [Nocardioidaceae bacterium]|nr:methyltransferase domain-containing protein [Nocardioidaceae bacterium]